MIAGCTDQVGYPESLHGALARSTDRSPSDGPPALGGGAPSVQATPAPAALIARCIVTTAGHMVRGTWHAGREADLAGDIRKALESYR